MTEFVAKHTTLTVPYEINEIVDNVLLELLMTAAEFKISRKGLMSGYEKLTREDIDGAGEHLQKEYGIELERGFFDYYSILANRQRTKKKISWYRRQLFRYGEAAEIYIYPVKETGTFYNDIDGHFYIKILLKKAKKPSKKTGGGVKNVQVQR